MQEADRPGNNGLVLLYEVEDRVAIRETGCRCKTNLFVVIVFRPITFERTFPVLTLFPLFL